MAVISYCQFPPPFWSVGFISLLLMSLENRILVHGVLFILGPTWNGEEDGVNFQSAAFENASFAWSNLLISSGKCLLIL